MSITGSLQQKSGTYYTVIQTNGKYKWKTTKIPVCGKSKRESSSNLNEARMILAKRIEEEKTRTTVICDMRFLQYIEDWLYRKSRDLRKNTMESYWLYYNKHIKPYFLNNNQKVSDVRPMDIQKYIDEKYNDGVSPNTINKHIVVISGAMSDAVRMNIIEYNPCERVLMPKVIKHIGTAYTQSQAQRLLEVCEGDPIETPVILALLLGLRRSEVAGLRWKDVDFKNNIVHIRNTVVRTTTTIEAEHTKSKASRRDMFMMPTLRSYLLSIHKYGKHVCSWPDGKAYSPDYISHRFSDVLKKYNLPKIKFHELRHTCGSLLFNSGLSAKQVQEYLGHEEISTTMDIYTHLDAYGKQEAASTMDNLFSSSLLES